jgi:hypothetical protein
VTGYQLAQRARLPGRALAGRELLGAGALVSMVAVSAKFVFDAASAPNHALIFSLGGRGYPSWLSGPFHGLGGDLTWNRFYAALLGMFVLWVAACALARSIPVAWIATAVGAVHVLFMLAPPIGLTDVFNYIAYARLVTEYGLNPYVDVLSQMPYDPVFPYATWPDWPSPYGPVAIVSMLPLGFLGVPQALWVTKVAMTGASLALVGLTAACARERDLPVGPAIAFVGLNPALLAFGVAGAHLDMLVMALCMGGVLLLLRGRAMRGGAVLAVAVAVKATAIVPLLFALVERARRRRVLLGAAIAAGAVGVLALALFGPHLLAGLADQRKITSPRSVPGLLGRALGFAEPPVGLTAGAAVGFVLAAAWLLRATYRGRDWLDAAGWATVALLLALTWLMPWYLVWLLPLAALSHGPRLRYAAIALTFFMVGVRLIPLGSG